MNSTPRILIGGIGNIFLGDDAFGSEVARRLMAIPEAFPATVKIVDFGIRGFDLTYALLEGYDAVVLIDAAPRGHQPGTLSVIEPDMTDQGLPADPQEAAGLMIDTHAMDPVKVLRLVMAMGGRLDRLLLVACEPGSLGSAVELDEGEMEMGMTPAVCDAVEKAVPLVESLVQSLVSRIVSDDRFVAEPATPST